MNRPTSKDLRMVIVTVPRLPQCVYCGDGLGELGAQTMDHVMRSIADHMDVCPNRPAPRSRTARRPIKGQLSIPVQ